MRKPAYKFQIDITPEQAETIIGKYNSFPLDGKPEVDVFAKICEILYVDGFRAYLDGMHKREDGCHFNWKEILFYTTVLDFQIAHINYRQ